MSRRLKKHQAEIGEGPHLDDTDDQLPDDDAGEIRSTGLWTKETKLSLVVLFFLLAGLGAAFYFRLSPESVGGDPFALLRSDPPKDIAEVDDAAVAEGFGLTPPSGTEGAESTSFPVASDPGNASYGDNAGYQPPDPWQSATPASQSPPVVGYSEDNDSFTQQASTLAEQTAASLADQGQQAVEGFNQQVEDMSQQATDAFGQQAQQTSDDMAGQFQEASDAVRDQVDSLSQQVNDGTSQEVQQQLGDLADQAQQAIEDYSGQAGQAVNEFMEQAPQSVDSVVSQAEQFVDDQMQQANEFTRQATDGLGDAVQDVAQSATPFPAAETMPEQSPLSAFEPAQAPAAENSYQQPGLADTSEPSVSIAEPPAAMETPTPRRASPAPPFESQATAPDYSQPSSQPLVTTPSRRRSSDAFGQPPERFDASAFEPPVEQTPEPTPPPRVQQTPPSVATTSPAPAPMVPTSRSPATTAAANTQPVASTSATGNFNRNQASYTVQANDNYWRISEKLYGNGAYFKALFEHNRDRFPRANRLKVGDVIQTPPAEVLQQTYPKLCPHPGRRTSSTGTPTGGSSISRRATGGGRTYVVRDGDTLYDIARYELGEANRWYEIKQLNRDILGDDAKSLRPGIELRLPTTDVASRTPSSINR